MVKSLLKLILALVSAGLIALWAAQHNARFNEVTLAQLITVLERQLDADINVEKSHLNALTGWINFESGSIIDRKTPGTRLSFSHAHIEIGKLMFLVHRKLDLYMTFHNLVMTSGKNEQGYTLPGFLERLAAESRAAMPAKIQSITVHNLTLSTDQCTPSLSLSLPGTITSFRHHRTRRWHGTLACTDGKLMVNTIPTLTQLTGAGSLTINPVPITTTAQLKLAGQSMLLPDHETLTTELRYEAKGQRLLITSSDKSHYAYFTALKETWYQLAHLPLASVEKLLKLFTTNTHKPLPPSALLGGKVAIKSHWNALDCTIGKGRITLTDVTMPRVEHGKGLIKFSSDGIVLNATGKVSAAPDVQLSGKGSWNWKACQGKIDLVNDSGFTPLASYPFTVKPHELHFSLDTANHVKATLEGIVSSPLHTEPSAIHGNAFADKNNFHASLTLPRGELFCDAHYDTAWLYDRLVFMSGGKKQFEFRAADNQPHKIKGIVRYRYLRSWLPTAYKQYLLGNRGLVHLNIDYEQWPTLSGSLYLTDGSLFIPQSYNLITQVGTRFTAQLNHRTAQFNELVCRCHTGSIVSPAVKLNWNDHGEICFVHAPITINDLLINWKKDFYGLLYGNVIARYQQGQRPHIQGDLIIRKSLLKENIFAQYSGSLPTPPADLLPSDQSGCDLDLTLLTEEALSAKTPVLQTTASVKLRLKGTACASGLSNPSMKGTVLIHQGTLNFLRHKLFITQGKIHFMSHRMNDPMIDLVAKNRIKKYLISLSVSGTAQAPHISFESMPELTEEQILSLLLSGSENTSLQAELPAIIMQNLNSLILGGKSLQPQTSRFFKRLTKPLQYIQLTPNFTDQTGRGGIKGTISVDITPQLHAYIQKDINLQEDLSFQIEYFLTDNLNLKAIRDARGDVGGQAEWSLKF